MKNEAKIKYKAPTNDNRYCNQPSGTSGRKDEAQIIIF